MPKENKTFSVQFAFLWFLHSPLLLGLVFGKRLSVDTEIMKKEELQNQELGKGSK